MDAIFNDPKHEAMKEILPCQVPETAGHGKPDTAGGKYDTSRLKNKLLMLHKMDNDLSAAGSFDELCRQAVISGSQLLECRRMSIWLRKENSTMVTGAFGVDEHGHIRDERAQLLTIGHTSPMAQVLNNRHPLWVTRDCALRDDKGDMVGKGMHVTAALWNGRRTVGCICMDNLLDQKSFTEEDFDLLGLYAATLGHLISEKWTEDELKKSLKEKEFLIDEVNHRVKNSLLTVSSLLDIQSAFMRDPHDAELLRQSRNKVQAITKASETFCRAKDLTRVTIHDYIMECIRDLFRSHNIDKSAILLRWEGSHESFPLSEAIPCGLIVSELVENALQHGFNLGKPNNSPLHGEIAIVIRRLDHHLSISIANDGVPFPPEIDIHHPTSPGLLLINTLVTQLKGTLTLDRASGARFTIMFPDKAGN